MWKIITAPFRWLKGNRTRFVGVAIGTLGIFEQFGREVIPQAYQGLTLMIVALLMLYLRQITTTPPGVQRVDDN